MNLSIIIGCYELTTQIERTIVSIHKALQRVPNITSEIIIADNSLKAIIDTSKSKELNFVLREYGHLRQPIHHIINDSVKYSKGNLLCVMIDGARLCSKGVFRKSLILFQHDPNCLIHIPNFQIGPVHQMYASEVDFGLKDEERLLIDLGWPNVHSVDLIRASTLEEHAGLGPTIFESNCLLVSRRIWDKVGGYDERFLRMDGGFASADLLYRLSKVCSALLILKNEGSFHQLHGGSTTISPKQTEIGLKDMTTEYRQIKGFPVRRSFGKPVEVIGQQIL
ncbi:glycosyltransferase family 2 protein [Prochlorococcus sp. MIT 1306]|uniref:glycosyltransferase family 2 protein n=1 Tax=Prochlorococcus sp. MIT 1306 TaxID=1799667 RepID=UPI0007B34798|nr:hypothetical protein [Prochlorococcus sp. MIT 1306]KZR65040.1 hypothetical protein PMIT1306_00721 [Prochlorococcus sp. MIT 1306]